MKARIMLGLIGTLVIVRVQAQESLLPKTVELSRAPALLNAYCSACHGWASSYDAIMAAGVVVPGDPESSPAWIMISSGQMPQQGPAPNADEQRAIHDWIAAGAPRAEATSGSNKATFNPAEKPPTTSRFLGFRSKTDFHRFSGWAAGGILLAAGVIGIVHAYDMMSYSHNYRDAHGIDDYDPAVCPGVMEGIWGSSTEQTLRWTHVGLVTVGESFYIANAVTGIGMITPDQPGLTKSKIHRWAFFVHAGLMASEIVMGFLTSDALRRGDHDLVSTLGVAHAAVGITIPIVILGAGTVMSLK